MEKIHPELGPVKKWQSTVALYWLQEENMSVDMPLTNILFCKKNITERNCAGQFNGVSAISEQFF